ncbi:MAG: RNA 2',3'-cyclic phosphodiesterase [Geminicoccaceae bacterium]|nr:RNA 2',3'-cyclic phosphodiesterase [Geminicoccaceae bacterium]
MPEEVAEALDRLCAGLPDARWTAIDDFHLTVRFIGDVDHSTFYELGQMLAEVTMPPFELELAGLGQFPPRGALRQLWVGLVPNAGLERLRRQVERCVHEVGITPERRKFQPHVTLARFRQPPPPARIAAFLQSRSLFRLPPFPINCFGLYSSHLRRDGAEHILEAEYDFVAGVMERS